MIHAHFGTVPRLMTVPSAYFRRAVLDETPYSVKAAYMQCTNPLMGYADADLTYQALNRLDFLAVSDVFMTPTAAMAEWSNNSRWAFSFASAVSRSGCSSA